ncbi:(2Fe-2S)-binding protein [Pseudactinotalea sp.]|uniref:(2Fe-2S)-binding protein n=1 Tax=Pseudactinotalea sp. TaxID=1926260 RepID=UPI003B3BD928
MSTRKITTEVNGRSVTADVETRWLLTDFLRHELGLTGTHVGCEQGVCGACTIHVDGEPVRACLMLAVQADGRRLRTVEGLAEGADQMHPLQEAFRECHGLQCGFCTPGFLMSLEPVLPDLVGASDETIRAALSGNVCRCTGYEPIMRAVRSAANCMACEAGDGCTPPSTTDSY